MSSSFDFKFRFRVAYAALGCRQFITVLQRARPILQESAPEISTNEEIPVEIFISKDAPDTVAARAGRVDIEPKQDQVLQVSESQLVVGEGKGVKIYCKNRNSVEI